MAVNFTPISEVLTGVVDLMPSMVDFVVGIMPIIIVMVVISFIAYFFDSIIEMIKGIF